MRWHAYIRTNRPGQEGSREEQYEAIQAYARKWRGEELDDDRIFADEAISGRTRIEDRPMGSQLVEALAAAYEAGAAVTLLVWSIDRLSRNGADVEELLRFTGGATVLCEVKPEPEEDPAEADDGEPDEEDWVTGDHVTFREQNGRAVIVVPDGADWRKVVLARMEKDQFWPNVWFISDHGNAHRLDLSDDAS